jgi:hypothetical protein
MSPDSVERNGLVPDAVLGVGKISCDLADQLHESVVPENCFVQSLTPLQPQVLPLQIGFDAGQSELASQPHTPVAVSQKPEGQLELDPQPHRPETQALLLPGLSEQSSVTAHLTLHSFAVGWQPRPALSPQTMTFPVPSILGMLNDGTG